MILKATQRSFFLSEGVMFFRKENRNRILCRFLIYRNVRRENGLMCSSSSNRNPFSIYSALLVLFYSFSVILVYLSPIIFNNSRQVFGVQVWQNDNRHLQQVLLFSQALQFSHLTLQGKPRSSVKGQKR